MKPAYRGIAVLVVQCAIALSVYGKYTLDRERLPRAWAKAAPLDPNLPIRGRYLAIRLEVETTAGHSEATFEAGHLSIRDGHLVLESDNAPFDSSTHVRAMRIGERWILQDPVAFFLPEHAADPSIVPRGKQLWVEVSVPPKGPPRPIRLEVR
jgi:hypothetical protein